jgi:hypothetical protein
MGENKSIFAESKKDDLKEMFIVFIKDRKMEIRETL